MKKGRGKIYITRHTPQSIEREKELEEREREEEKVSERERENFSN